MYISDYSGSPNIFRLSLDDGSAVQLTDNRDGYLKSYVYYDGTPYKGLGKASPSFNPLTSTLLYLQGNDVRVLHVDTLAEETVYRLPGVVMTGFTHISPDGRYACVPYIDAEAFSVDAPNPFRPIMEKVVKERIESHLLVIDLASGQAEVWGSQVGWITHVQFRPGDHGQILYNHEGGMVDQRIWLYGGGRMEKIRDQSTEEDTIWICHEMWLAQGNGVIYHGTKGIPNDPAMRGTGQETRDVRSFVGRYELDGGSYTEIEFPPEFEAYGHFTASPDDRLLVTDGIIDSVSIHVCKPDWGQNRIAWTKICEHSSSLVVQDVHPHPIFSHDGLSVLFTADAHNERGKGHLYLVEPEGEFTT